MLKKSTKMSHDRITFNQTVFKRKNLTFFENRFARSALDETFQKLFQDCETAVYAASKFFDQNSPNREAVVWWWLVGGCFVTFGPPLLLTQLQV